MARALRDSGAAPLVILFDDGLLARKLRDDGIPVTVLRRRPRYDPRAVRELRATLRDAGVNVLHVHGYKAALVGGLAARGLGVRVLKTEHGLVEPPSGWRDLMAYARLRANVGLERVASRWLVDAVVFVSKDIHGARRDVGSRIRQRIIYNGIEPTPQVHARRRRDSGQFHLGIVGRISKVKGHEDLLRAMSHLAHLRELRLHIFGTGPMEQDCRRLCDELGVSDRVVFHGFQHAIHEHMAALDLLVMPSLHEGLPYVLLEAMHLRVPVVASRVGGLAEVLDDGPVGVTVPRRDARRLAAAIERLYRDPALRAQLARRAYARVQAQFLAGRMLREYGELYRELAEAG